MTTQHHDAKKFLNAYIRVMMTEAVYVVLYKIAVKLGYNGFTALTSKID